MGRHDIDPSPHLAGEGIEQVAPKEPNVGDA
jgi:hypothetical protein